MQGHSSPGIYARAFLEGRLSEEQLRRFRQEVDGGGLSSYPHPWLMPDFWQFPTVSMGLGPLMAIYQARFLKYLAARGVVDPGDRKVWAFMGDGEMDEPESMGAISLAGREKLDNLVFVINCNLQRLDGPVRGNGKIIQELETNFRGAGWNVIKVIWGSGWDPLLEADTEGWLHFRDGGGRRRRVPDLQVEGRRVRPRALLRQVPRDPRDGRGLDATSRSGSFVAAATTRRRSTPPTPPRWRTRAADGDPREDDQGLRHGGGRRGPQHHPPAEVDERRGTPRDPRPARAPAHRRAGDRRVLPPAGRGQPRARYLLERRAALGGSLPARHTDAEPLPTPPPFTTVLEGSGERENSTTMAFVRILNSLVRDPAIGERIVPIVPDESRTFGMEGMFRQLGIFSQVGQLYQPEDSEDFMFYREDEHGQILQEGINEPGAFSSWIAAATSYANHGVTMVPFYVFYSMFGFQRVGDLAWAAGDSRARGFLIGATAGRTTLNGEGLQHEDGHSHLLASVVPNCRAYDPTYAYELAVIVRDGLRRMCEEQEDVFYYLTVMNENYVQPAMPEGVEEGILRGMYLLREGAGEGPRVQLLGSGAILREVIAGADLLEADFGIASDVWSVTSFTELRRDGLEVERWNRLHPTEEQRLSLRRGGVRGHAAGRSSRRPTTCARSPTRSGRSFPAATPCSAPTASGAATTGSSCGSSSRSIGTTSR